MQDNGINSKPNNNISLSIKNYFVIVTRRMSHKSSHRYVGLLSVDKYINTSANHFHIFRYFLSYQWKDVIIYWIAKPAHFCWLAVTSIEVPSRLFFSFCLTIADLGPIRSYKSALMAWVWPGWRCKRRHRGWGVGSPVLSGPWDCLSNTEPGGQGTTRYNERFD